MSPISDLVWEPTVTAEKILWQFVSFGSFRHRIYQSFWCKLCSNYAKLKVNSDDRHEACDYLHHWCSSTRDQQPSYSYRWWRPADNTFTPLSTVDSSATETHTAKDLYCMHWCFWGKGFKRSDCGKHWHHFEYCEIQTWMFPRCPNLHNNFILLKKRLCRVAADWQDKWGCSSWNKPSQRALCMQVSVTLATATCT